MVSVIVFLISVILICFGLAFICQYISDLVNERQIKDLAKKGIKIIPPHDCQFEKIKIESDMCNCKHELYYCKICGTVVHKVKE